MTIGTAALPALAGTCTSLECTGSSATGQDSTDRTTFNNDNNNLTFSNITFDNASGTYATAEGLDANTAPSAQLSGVDFISCLSNQSPCATNTSTLTVGNIAGTPNWDGGTDPALKLPCGCNPGKYDTITISLPAFTYAFGVDLLDANGLTSPPPFVIQVSGPTVNSDSGVLLPGSVFFGYSSATPITSLSIYAANSNEQLAIDNFEVGEQAQTPEVATLLLVASGLFLLRLGRRWLPGGGVSHA